MKANKEEIILCENDIIKYFKKNKGYKNAILGTSKKRNVKTLEKEIGWSYKTISSALKKMQCSDVMILNVPNTGYFMPDMRLKTDKEVVKKIQEIEFRNGKKHLLYYGNITKMYRLDKMKVGK